MWSSSVCNLLNGVWAEGAGGWGRWAGSGVFGQRFKSFYRPASYRRDNGDAVTFSRGVVATEIEFRQRTRDSRPCGCGVWLSQELLGLNLGGDRLLHLPLVTCRCDSGPRHRSHGAKWIDSMCHVSRVWAVHCGVILYERVSHSSPPLNGADRLCLFVHQRPEAERCEGHIRYINRQNREYDLDFEIQYVVRV